MPKPIIVIGHGISGCVLALSLYRRDLPFHLYGTTLPGEASMASSGLIAPVTGRRYVKTWNIDLYLASSVDFYTWTETWLADKFFHEAEILRFLSNPEAKNAWESRCGDPAYKKYVSSKTYDFADQFGRPYGILTGGYRLDTQRWLQEVRNFLEQKKYMTITDEPVLPEHFPNETVVLATGAVNEKLAHGIIPNKGEALIVRMPDWKIPIIVKDEIFVVPLTDGQFWVGSHYQPWPEDPLPTAAGKQALLKAIRKIYQGPIEVVRHLAGLRPTVEDRRPVIGLMPGEKDIYQFNGMGTKATSLAPFWANQLIHAITEGLSLSKEVSPDRY